MKIFSMWSLPPLQNSMGGPSKMKNKRKTRILRLMRMTRMWTFKGNHLVTTTRSYLLSPLFPFLMCPNRSPSVNILDVLR
jgi:hypothetical protein